MNNQQIKFYSIPEWAKFIAQDGDGRWWAFEDEPELDGDWFCKGRSERVSVVVSSTLKEVNR